MLAMVTRLTDLIAPEASIRFLV